jgi:polyribonucleotide nucleotidyltransferase
MAKALTEAKGELSKFAPQIVTLMIPKDKIRDVIGTGGKVIREIVETTGCKIDIEDDGTVKVAATDAAAIEKAVGIIKGLTSEPELHRVYDGKVAKTADFGAFVTFMPNRDGLVHISELADYRVAKTTDIVKEGDQVKVMVIGFDERGKIKLSMKRVDQQTGQPVAVKERPQREEGEEHHHRERGDRDRDRGDRDGGRRRSRG